MERSSEVEEAILLGRRPVSGIVNASRLAAIVRFLRSSASAHRPTYKLRLSEQGLEVSSLKYDEGFESDDSTSTKSDEERTGDTSSGVSDLDDQALSDTSLNNSRVRKENYSIWDILFCHSDASFPRVLVWVVSSSRCPPPNNLEALVFECRKESSVRRLCGQYKETRQRLKMQMMSSKRRQDRVSSYLQTRVPDSFSEIFLDKSVRQREDPFVVADRREEKVQWTQQEEPPKRPERRRFLRRKPQDDILRGTFVRVHVNQNPSPVLLKPQFSWMYGVSTTAELVLYQSAPAVRSSMRRSFRSASPSVGRTLPTKPSRSAPKPVPSYFSSVQGLTQKLRDMTPISSTLKRCAKHINRRGHEDQNGTLKPVIKKTNKKLDADLLAEPKKVTFSAYATVQVVE